MSTHKICFCGEMRHMRAMSVYLFLQSAFQSDYDDFSHAVKSSYTVSEFFISIILFVFEFYILFHKCAFYLFPVRTCQSQN